MNITISKTSEEEIHEFLKENYKQFENDFIEFSENTKYYHKLYCNSTRYELYHENALIGLVCVYYNINLHQAYIPYICISDKYKGMGLGTSMLTYLFDDIKKNHKYVDFISLEVLISNIIAQSFYNKFSFIEISRNSLKIQMKKFVTNKNIRYE